MIYLDNAATTKTAPEVVDAMLPYFSEYYGNASTIYSLGAESKKAMDHARQTIADSLGAKPEEIYFTAGGSESDNWALKATAEAYASKGKHIITTKIEHHAILHTCEYLEKRGFEITYLNVDRDGLISLDELKAAIRPDTILISVMFANNEIGTIEPIAEIGEIAKEHGVLFHTDAVQAYAQVPINVDEMHIDMLSASGHKLNGPKGIGFLYIRKGVKIRSFVHSWYRGTGCCCRARYAYYGYQDSQGDRTAGLSDRTSGERDPSLLAERSPYEETSEQYQLLLPVHRRRIHVDHAGYEGHLRFQRFRMYFRISGSFPCTAGYRLKA